MRKFKFNIEQGKYYGGVDSDGRAKGAWMSSTSQQFSVVIEARNPQEAESIALAQYGGKHHCKVRPNGEVK